jgi:LDH2 family malate/lactate/ureidoglycolate dehydrogenase
MVLDIANTGVARAKVYLARQKGLPIPEGWAINGSDWRRDVGIAVDKSEHVHSSIEASLKSHSMPSDNHADWPFVNVGSQR